MIVQFQNFAVEIWVQREEAATLFSFEKFIFQGLQETEFVIEINEVDYSGNHITKIAAGERLITRLMNDDELENLVKSILRDTTIRTKVAVFEIRNNSCEPKDLFV